jgi:hypothetical protein
MIMLETPQIFTRGRLVNDRATEQAWLEGRLRITDDLLKDGRFATSQEIREVNRSLALIFNPGNVGTPPKPEGQDELKKRLGTLELKATPQEQWEDAALYRLAIRNTLMSTVLDDRHDIEGNTIYRLNFNVSVVPPQNSDRLAIVVVELHEANPSVNVDTRKQEPELRNTAGGIAHARRAVDSDRYHGSHEQLHGAYVDLLYDWRSKLQDMLATIVTDRLLTIQEYNNPLEPVENSAFHAWLLDRTRGELQKLIHGESAQAIDDLIESIRLRYDQTLGEAHADTIEKLIDQIARDQGGPGGDPNGFRAYVRSECISKERVDLPPHQSKRPGSYPCAKRRVSPLVVRMDILDVVQLIRSTAVVEKSCLTGVRLPFLVTAVALDGSATPANCRSSIEELRKRRNLVLPEDRRRDLLARFEAGYILSKQTKSNLSLREDESGKQIPLTLAHFFVFEDPAQCAPGSCQPILRFANNDVEGVARRLSKLVGPRGKAFTYSVSPNKLVRRAEVAQTLATNMAAAAARAATPAASATSASEAATRGLENDPTIIGFGDWDSSRSGKLEADRQTGANTKFGWAMFPRASRDGTGARQHLPENYSVSATVSLPGWWKTAHLSVRTCWVRQSDLGSKEDDLDRFCARGKRRTFDLRLPGDAGELMQHLRFEVIRTPFLERPTEDPDLESGREAKVLIRGGRLWRSPVVKLANQQADRIEVLPDMTGIIATFDCVDALPPPVVPRNPPDPAGREPANLFLVTSEGKIPYPIRVMVRPFRQLPGESPMDACYMHKQITKRQSLSRLAGAASGEPLQTDTRTQAPSKQATR